MKTIIIDDNRIMILNKEYSFKNIEVLDNLLRDLFSKVIFSNIELIKIVYHDDGVHASYKKVDSYSNTNGSDSIKLFVNKEYLSIVKPILSDLDYYKVKNPKRTLK